jgi:hypothetical protein
MCNATLHLARTQILRNIVQCNTTQGEEGTRALSTKLHVAELRLADGNGGGGGSGGGGVSVRVHAVQYSDLWSPVRRCCVDGQATNCSR